LAPAAPINAEKYWRKMDLSVSSGGHLSFQLPAELVVGAIVHELAGVAETAEAGLLVVLAKVRLIVPPADDAMNQLWPSFTGKIKTGSQICIYI
jgi:hypothetical protein